jgi:integrase
MARKIKDAVLDSRAARVALKPRGKPYYRTLERGLHLGYRRLAGQQAGSWSTRTYLGEQSYEVEVIGSADDYSNADGVKILDFYQAQTKAREGMVKRAHAGKNGPLTVRVAVESYIEFLEANRKSAPDARYAADAFILPLLGDLEVSQLATDQIRKWHHKLATRPARIRSKRGEKQQFKVAPENDPDYDRRRKSTANRILTILKAALNRAWRDGKTPSDTEWRRVEPFEGVESARIRYASMAEATRLLNASDPDFRKLVRGALETGARYGELCAMLCSDFNPDSGTVAVRMSKGGKPRHIVLTDEGTQFFSALVLGRAGKQNMFVKADGEPWLADHQAEPMREANRRANISPPINFHALRHTWASHAVMNGVPMLLVARNLGHADTRMVEKHYGHLAPSYVVDAIRAGAPKFGFVPDKKLATLS